MSETALARKLKIKPGMRAAIVNPIEGFMLGLGQLPDAAKISHKLQGSFDWVQIFVKDKAEFDALASKAI